MTTVFISGSREVPFLPEGAKERIDRIMDREFDIVIGDSERGVDTKVIEYLSTCRYEHVTIFTIHSRPRAKGVLETWGVRKITPEAEEKISSNGEVRNARELETFKDEAMTETADYGLVIWKSTFTNRFGKESASKGSLRNMYHLVSTRKPVVLYKCADDVFDADFTCFELRSVNDLERVVVECPSVVRKAYQAIAKRMGGEHSQEAALF